MIPDEWTLIVGGAASAVFGVLLAVWPKEGLIALVWIFGVFAVVFGIATGPGQPGSEDAYRLRRRTTG